MSTVSDYVLKTIVFGLTGVTMEEKGRDGANSAIIAYHSESPFTTPAAVFISDVVRDLVVDAHLGRVMDLITTAPPSLRSLCGTVFERLACQRLAAGTSCRVRALRHASGTSCGTRVSALCDSQMVTAGLRISPCGFDHFEQTRKGPKSWFRSWIRAMDRPLRAQQVPP